MLPHERTHAGPKEGRLRLLRATRTQLEPIFVLYDARARVRAAGRRAGDGRRRRRRSHARWPIEAGEVTIDTPLLIADGHHRYETAVAYRAENPEATHTFAVLVSSRAPGVEIFPTHRLVQELGDVPGEPVDRPERRRHALPRPPLHARRDRRRLRPARRRVVRAARASPTRRTPTRRSPPSTAATPRRRSCSQPVTVDQVARFAHAGEVMPQKSTFFYPKLTSGLLFHPL